MKELIFNNKKTILYGLCTLVITFIIVMSCWCLWGKDIKVPLTGYRHDSVGTLLEASNYVRGGSLHKNVNHGAPYLNRYMGGGFGDSSTPMPLIKLVWKITGSVEAGINIHAILNILLLSISTFYVCKKVKISDFSSMIAGIAYANLSFFLMYANTLLMIYSTCFYIPFFAYLLIDLMREIKGQQSNNELTWKKLIFTVSVMLYLGINSAYYAFLALIILAFVAVYVLFVSKQVEKVMLILISFMATGAGIMVYTLPKMLHSMGYTDIVLGLGAKLFVILLILAVLVLLALCFIVKKLSVRITMKTVYITIGILAVLAGGLFVIMKRFTDYFGEYDGRSLLAVEMGALRIINLIMPAPNNIIDAFNQPLEIMVDVNSGDYTVLGIVAGIGFLYSVINIFRYNESSGLKSELLKICGLLNSFMAVVCIKGGLASLIAMFVTTGIRNYNRIIVFIAIFSLISFSIMLDEIFEKIKKCNNEVFKKCANTAVYALVIFMLAISIPSYFIFKTQYGLMDYEQRKQEYDEWHRYMAEVEASVPENAMILELPLSIDETYHGILMEESGQAYELAVPAILSKTTAWTYAGGNKSVKWKRVMRGIEDTQEMVLAAAASGIEGIYVDTLMYNDDSYIQIIEDLEKILGEPIVCKDSRRYFFSMTEYMKALKENYTDEQLEQIKKDIEAQF